MPMPEPARNEAHDDFIGRCMGALAGEFENSDQRYAVCEGQWRDRRRAAMTRDLTGIQRKTFPVAEVKEVEGVTRTLEFTITTGSVDRDNDTIAPGGWNLDSYKANPVVLWAHSYKDLPVARATSITMHGDKMTSVAEFPPRGTYPFADTVYDMLKGGFLNATSVGFRPQKYVFNAERGGVDFKEQELLEYSIVPVPANAEALVLARDAGIDVALVKAWAEETLKAFGPTPSQSDVPAFSGLVSLNGVPVVASTTSWSWSTNSNQWVPTVAVDHSARLASIEASLAKLLAAKGFPSCPEGGACPHKPDEPVESCARGEKCPMRVALPPKSVALVPAKSDDVIVLEIIDEPTHDVDRAGLHAALSEVIAETVRAELMALTGRVD